MNLQVIFAILLGSIASVGWSMAGKYSGAHPSWVGILIMGGTALWITLRSTSFIVDTSIAPWQIMILLCAAVINGEAVYQIAIAMHNPNIQGSILPLAIVGTSVLVGLIIGWAMFREPMSSTSFISALLILLGVFGLYTQIS